MSRLQQRCANGAGSGTAGTAVAELSLLGTLMGRVGSKASAVSSRLWCLAVTHYFRASPGMGHVVQPMRDRRHMPRVGPPGACTTHCAIALLDWCCWSAHHVSQADNFKLLLFDGDVVGDNDGDGGPSSAPGVGNAGAGRSTAAGVTTAALSQLSYRASMIAALQLDEDKEGSANLATRSTAKDGGSMDDTGDDDLLNLI
jgi:hypothetical protein